METRPRSIAGALVIGKSMSDRWVPSGPLVHPRMPIWIRPRPPLGTTTDARKMPWPAEDAKLSLLVEPVALRRRKTIAPAVKGTRR